MRNFKFIFDINQDSDTDNKFLAAPIFYQDGVYIDQKGS